MSNASAPYGSGLRQARTVTSGNTSQHSTSAGGTKESSNDQATATRLKFHATLRRARQDPDDSLVVNGDGPGLRDTGCTLSHIGGPAPTPAQEQQILREVDRAASELSRRDWTHAQTLQRIWRREKHDTSFEDYQALQRFSDYIREAWGISSFAGDVEVTVGHPDFVD